MSRLRARLFSLPALGVLVGLVVVAQLAGPRLVDAVRSDDPADERYSAVCREHGGTPTIAPGSGDYVKDARSCEVRYGGRGYEMYAVTPDGFDTAEAQRAERACDLLIAQDRTRERRDGAAPRHVWHPRTAICELQL
jgi:hypothetical protein